MEHRGCEVTAGARAALAFNIHHLVLQYQLEQAEKFHWEHFNTI